MLRINAAVQAYDWGSPTAVPTFLGVEPSGQPVAELWFGTHPLGTSTVDAEASQGADAAPPLTDVVPDLPFMLKVLAPAEPLSIQVHPALEVAAAGFDAEEAAGVDLASPSRDYKDALHKPEMVYALSAFDTLVGLRPASEVVALLEPLDTPVARTLLAQAASETSGDASDLVAFLLTDPPDRAHVDAFVDACVRAREAGHDVGRGYLSVIEAAQVHPGDPGIVVTLLLKRTTLEPGEAAFIGPGLVHAHLSGLCLEVMTASDNVFRGGLTTKRVNAEGFLGSLDADYTDDPAVTPRAHGAATQIYAPDGDLFALSITTGDEVELPGSGSRILLCLDGEVDVASASGDRVHLTQGQALYAAPGDGALSVTGGVTGGGTVAQAYVP